MIYLLINSLIVRMAGSALLSFFIVLVMGGPMIRFLLRQKLRDRPEFDHADLNELTKNKSNIPTMGGMLIVIAIFLSILVFADLGNMYIRMTVLVLLWLGGLGAVDDWIKLHQVSDGKSRDGLKSWEKILFQIGLAVLIAIFTWNYGRLSHVPTGTGAALPPHEFYLPFRTAPVPLSLLAYVVIVVVTMVGSSNAVNLTDGMDGLAPGCMIIICPVFLMLSWLAGWKEQAEHFNLPLVVGATEMTIVCASMFGACLGFLWYNAPPAQVFMGDTGSLPLGGLIGYIAVVSRQEILLFIAGGVFVMEALSVILQVSYFKMTKPGPGMQGKRLFRCAPLHHHFHLNGWPETKVVIRFWILAIVFAAMALATLPLR